MFLLYMASLAGIFFKTTHLQNGASGDSISGGGVAEPVHCCILHVPLYVEKGRKRRNAIHHILYAYIYACILFFLDFKLVALIGLGERKRTFSTS